MDAAKVPLKEKQIFSYDGLSPEIDESVFIASGAKIIGDVRVGANASIWFNCVIRGDIAYIAIGSESNVQDGTVIHVSKNKPAIIGSKVTIGHKACIHACTIEDYTLVGMNATILDGAVVQTKSMVAAGSVVKQNFVVPTGKLVAGVPAKIVRDLTEEDIKYFEISAKHYMEYSSKLKEGM
jgi:carbonic anhydrase/acetyltransferase-like protein (isoleucine patch superfamily)